jgi:hypothetical protein
MSSEQNTENQTTVAEAAAPVLYDSDAGQVIKLHTERRGVLYPVSLIFRAGALNDESILEYERAKDQRISDAEISEADERDAVAITGQAYKAALLFASKNLERTEGYAGNASEKDQVFAVNQLLGAEFDELPLAMGDVLCPEEDDENSTYRLKCASSGTIIITTHEMRAATKDEISESQALLSRVLIVKGTKLGVNDQRIPSKAKRWGELYDLMKASAGGYAGKIPLHHKMLVAMRHLKSEQKAITGN